MEVDTEMDKGLQEQRYQLLYVGGSPLDARTTLPMLPWLVAGVRRNAGEKARPVELRLRWSPPLLRCVTTGDGDGSRLVFEHRGRRVARFVHGGHERAYFAYLLRGQGEEDSSCPGGPHMECHVFKASEAGQVPEVISSIRQVLKAALKEDARSKLEGEEAFYNSQRFEVLYCGKVLVAHKKVPPTLIDDCIDKFRHHEMELSRLRQDGGSEAEEEEEASEPGSVVEDVGLEEHQGEFRMRCNSVVTGLQKKPTETGQRGASRRRHASAPSHVQPSDAEKNRTMLFQIGRFEINIISPESKTVVLEKNFKDIYSCSQGIKQMDHFGFICRDAGECGQSQYVCYVFQCASESLVEEIMQTLKQAFTTASVLQSAKTSVKLCEACPMHDLHKLCERIEGLYPPRAKLAIQRYISQLSDNEQVDIFERVQRKKPSSDQEENELVINHLRQLCEAKQKTHLHIGEVPQNVPNSVTSDGGATVGRFKLDILRNRARSSLTSSLENIFSRGASRVRGRLGSMGNIGSSDQDDLIGDSPPGTPLSSSGAFSEDDSEEQLFRRRAHTLPVKKKISFCELQPQSGKATDQLQSSHAAVSRSRSVSEGESSFGLPSSFSTTGFLKTFYFLGSLADSVANKSSNGEGRRRTIACSSDLLGAGFTPRRVSWRQRIFLQVASPMNRPSESMHHPEGLDIGELLPLSPDTDSQDRSSVSSTSPDSDSPGQERPIRSPAEYQALWRRAVHQQILLLRMEQENQPLEACSDEPHITMMKLDYQELGQCPEEVLALWEKKLSAPGKSKAQWDKEEIQSLVSQGVPKSRRGEVWQLLVQQNRARRHHHPTCRQQPPDMNYQDLLKQLTAQQHAILVDLGRTFPTHQYFSAQLGAGQLSLYNLLKAYSLLDTEVGYCQGISFVAGVLLLHMSEEQAFDILKFLMYDLGFRRQYRPDMTSLQVQMYQLSRLLHDYHRELHGHLEQHEVSPSLYAAPWFLTLFASQYPLGFVARIFDILFVQGTEVIFKIALSLLSSHEAEIMQCDSFETVVDYLKNTLPNLTQAQMERTVAQVLPMNISKQLHAYEVEYHVLQDELMDTVFLPDDIDRLHRLERANNQLKKQNMDLLEKLQASRIKVQSLEANVENFLARESKMKQQIRSLEQERGSYQRLVERMRGCVAPGVLSDVELTPIPAGAKTGHAGQTR